MGWTLLLAAFPGQVEALITNCERCGKPGEVFYYKGVEAILCGDCLPHLDEVVDAKLAAKATEG